MKHNFNNRKLLLLLVISLLVIPGGYVTAQLNSDNFHDLARNTVMITGKIDTTIVGTGTIIGSLKDSTYILTARHVLDRSLDIPWGSDPDRKLDSIAVVEIFEVKKKYDAKLFHWSKKSDQDFAILKVIDNELSKKINKNRRIRINPKFKYSDQTNCEIISHVTGAKWQSRTTKYLSGDEKSNLLFFSGEAKKGESGAPVYYSRDELIGMIVQAHPDEIQTEAIPNKYILEYLDLDELQNLKNKWKIVSPITKKPLFWGSVLASGVLIGILIDHFCPDDSESIGLPPSAPSIPKDVHWKY